MTCLLRVHGALFILPSAQRVGSSRAVDRALTVRCCVRGDALTEMSVGCCSPRLAQCLPLPHTARNAMRDVSCCFLAHVPSCDPWCAKGSLLASRAGSRFHSFRQGPVGERERGRETNQKGFTFVTCIVLDTHRVVKDTPKETRLLYDPCVLAPTLLSLDFCRFAALGCCS